MCSVSGIFVLSYHYWLLLADSPSIELVEPSGVVQANVGSSRVLRCRAEGRPAPAYQWLHQQGPGGQVEVVATSRDLELQALGYREAGDYICRVTNTISGEERSAESEVITIQVGVKTGFFLSKVFYVKNLPG